MAATLSVPLGRERGTDSVHRVFQRETRTQRSSVSSFAGSSSHYAATAASLSLGDREMIQCAECLGGNGRVQGQAQQGVTTLMGMLKAGQGTWLNVHESRRETPLLVWS